MEENIRLGPEDPTIFAKCPRCSRRGIGEKVGRQFYRAYTFRRWQRKPKCENCRTPMVMLYAIKADSREEKSRGDRRNLRPLRTRNGGANVRERVPQGHVARAARVPRVPSLRGSSTTV